MIWHISVWDAQPRHVFTRAFQLADQAGLAVTKLREIYSQEVE